MMRYRDIARTFVHVSAWSWLVFSALEFWRPTLVTRLFSPHWFAVALVAAVIWQYRATVKRLP